MNSSRLPGKAMLAFGKRSAIELLIDRVKLVMGVNGIILATTDSKFDDCIVTLAKNNNILYYRGSEEDVLLRVAEAAIAYQTDIIIQITGDTTFVDPDIVSAMLQYFVSNMSSIDVLVNDNINKIALGFTVRIFKAKSLFEIERKATHLLYRENVEGYFYNHKGEFNFTDYPLAKVYMRSDIRVTLDTLRDYIVMRNVYDAIGENKILFSALDVIKYLDEHPEVKEINCKIVQNSLMHAG